MHAPPPMTRRSRIGSPANSIDEAPDYRALAGRLIERLRYGENPHQSARSIALPEQRFGVATARQAQGKQLSYNNINDTDAAYECVGEFNPARAACVIIKHANPCGVAEGDNLASRLSQGVGLRSGIGVRRRRRGQPHARRGRGTRHHRDFHRSYYCAGRERRSDCDCRWQKDLRLLLAGGLPNPRARGVSVKTVAGGLLVQSRDNAVVDEMELKPVTRRAPTNAELRDLRLPSASPST